ncbi:NAD(P)/FAD-dependent oxidoreductase [Roseococcus sp. SYP-B2431]|uniref:flavin-containing monooxygenase n=1 Tax=Roseococcus sp. SYP-B2431 TaxID=2496640 RepID=UPI00103B9F42|nr:NAD(P)/FAD-dependent oxidoreductase [Roseococcus sp. SYP-B2431]TCH99512.1 NAD(P)/FAD-dependent oxidoreductase [Roseococcus sp. SYP-B2431]
MNVMDRPASSTAAAWLEAFDKAMTAGDAEAATALFLPDGHWRDVLAFGWDIVTSNGADAIAERLRAALDRTRPRGVRLSGRTPPRRVKRAGTECIEAMFTFETATGPCEGVLRLVTAESGTRAWILLTTLDAIRGHEERLNRAGAGEADYQRDFGGENWLDKRLRHQRYEDREPAVLVIGAGQSGLGIAARLGALGVDTLVVDRQQRIGDNWRKRYHALTLHNEVHVNHLPYMPFPPTWPVFIPKDKLAGWFEAYAEAMDLNVWTGTDFRGGDWDEAGGHWRVTLRRADGSERLLKPRHLVFATGVSSIPVKPKLPGLEDFEGTILHSGAYTEGAAWEGRPTLVLGSGNSGHDVAQDLAASGSKVTIVQRSPTYVVGIREAQRVYSIYAEGIPFEDCDLLAMASPFPVMKHGYQLSTAHSRQVDKPLLDALEARGFRLDYGPDETGFQMKYLQRGGGYYFNVGASDMIVEGRIGLLQFADIDRFVTGGARLKDGSVVPAELLVLATGYLNQQEVVRHFLGSAIADRIGPVWGFGEDGELRNMWRPTGQDGLWFTAGSLAQSRIYSKVLALQIQARELGLA